MLRAPAALPVLLALLSLCTLLWAGLLPRAAQAQQLAQQLARQIDTDLELVLMADASGSIDAGETRFQREGYAGAITDPEVLAAIAGTAYGAIAVTYVEWGGVDSHDVVVPWMRISGPEQAADFAERLLEAPRRAHGMNAIGVALLLGKGLIEQNDITGWRRIIDFSGDSARNYNGPSIEAARAEVLKAGITINGLAVACADCRSGQVDPQDLTEAFRTQIIGGRGAFVVTADSPAVFAAAVRRKLILEISGEIPGGGIEREPAGPKLAEEPPGELPEERAKKLAEARPP